MTVMTAYEGKYQRVSISALQLMSADLIGRYGHKKLRVIFSHVRVEPRLLVGKLTDTKVFDILSISSRDSSIAGFLEILEYITSPLLFSGDEQKAEVVLQRYINLLGRENFEYKDGSWYVGPTKEEEESSIASDFYYWRNSKGEELELETSLFLPKEKVDVWVTHSDDSREFYYDNKKIKWNSNDDIYKAFNVLFHSVNEKGFVTYEDYQKELKKRYPHDYKKRENSLRAWILKNLTQTTEGIIKKTKDTNLVKPVRGKGLQFNNVKLP